MLAGVCDVRAIVAAIVIAVGIAIAMYV